MTKSFLAAGLVLIALGLGALGMVLAVAPTVAEPAPIAVDDSPRSQQAWIVIGGLALAAGGGCLGLGMNRWTAHRRSA